MTTQVHRNVVLKLERISDQVPRPCTSGAQPTKRSPSFVEFVGSSNGMVAVSVSCSYISRSRKAATGLRHLYMAFRVYVLDAVYDQTRDQKPNHLAPTARRI